eukprot:132251_1
MAKRFLSQIQTISILTLVMMNLICHNMNSVIVSDVDEELIILIQFKNIIDVHSIRLHALTVKNIDDNLSAPKQVYIYKLDNISKTFTDLQSIKPNKSIKCSVKKLRKGGQNINLKKDPKNAIQFKSTQYLGIYIQSNQNDTEKTYLNGIQVMGIDSKQQQSQISFQMQNNPKNKSSNTSNTSVATAKTLLDILSDRV